MCASATFADSLCAKSLQRPVFSRLIDALSQRNRAHGLVQGLGHERDYLAKVAYLSEKDEVRPGDVMVTSGSGASGGVGTVRKRSE